MNIDTSKTVNGYKLFELEPKPIKEFAPFCRKVAADSAVLLKNDNNTLPFLRGEVISVFGRTQFDYNKSGTGSGGLVNVEYITNITNALEKSGVVTVNDELKNIYCKWLEKNPHDNGKGWGNEPWCQKEMPFDEALCSRAADKSDKAVVVIGRTAGEDHDNSDTEGSYRLTQEEKNMLSAVTSVFDKVCVVLNVGNIIDMSFVDEYKPESVIYVWHGGMEGGNAVADVLCGKVCPSGKLADTVAYSINDYPSNDNFGDDKQNIYAEDIYVGYRYFETFCPEKVRYPFGFGLSYTSFDIKTVGACEKSGKICLDINVKNTGAFDGKEVVQVYYSAPSGKLGKPFKSLVCYKKTKLLKPLEEQMLKFEFDICEMASYDDSGVTGYKNCFVLESGAYKIYVGNSARNNEAVFELCVADATVTQECSEALAPVKSFERIKPVEKDGKTVIEFENVPCREIDLNERILQKRPADIAFTGDKGFKLVDVADEKCTLEQFVAQFNDEDLFNIVRGEGMNSFRVTSGTGCAFGGIANGLIDFGIPAVCGTDGPSGIRMDCGNKATAMPIGTALACTFDDQLVEQLHIFEGLELRSYNIDALLGPGLNIHRHPLNGRNFEYFSEDPIVSGRMAAAVTRGIAKSGPTSVIKHFACNNQEIGRSSADSVVSQRALREIYLKGFEIAVKDGGATSIMTSYNPLNGYWNAGNYDLTTTILREEWGYTGFVMTDWWAKMNCETGEAFNTNLKQMVRAQNDIYMVCKCPEQNPDNLKEGIDEGYITRGEIQRCAMNILKYILKTPTFEKFVLGGCVKPENIFADDSEMTEVFSLSDLDNSKDYDIELEKDGKYVLTYDLHIDADVLSQYWCSILVDGNEVDNMSLCGTNGKKISIKQPVELNGGKHKIRIESDNRFRMDKLTFRI